MQNPFSLVRKAYCSVCNPMEDFLAGLAYLPLSKLPNSWLRLGVLLVCWALTLAGMMFLQRKLTNISPLFLLVTFPAFWHHGATMGKVCTRLSKQHLEELDRD